MKIYDVKTAYLHGKLKEEIYMELPDGIQENHEKVCKLKRSIYGLKQAGKCWNEFLTEIMIKCGMKYSKEDPCLFYAIEKNRFVYCGIHVDDMITVSSDDEFERGFMKKIEQYMEIKDLGEAKTVLGMEVTQEEGKVYVDQKNYIKRLLELYEMEECNIVRSPMDLNVKMEEYKESERVDVRTYQELMGRLMYLSVHTRPDLSFALSCLSQFNTDPRAIHMTGLKRILRYLKGTINYQLQFGKQRKIKKLECETDASWDRTEDAKSINGILLYWNGDLVHWRCRKQKRVALSSTESELEAMLEGVNELTWTAKLLQEIGLSNEIQCELKCDNLNAVRLANGGNFKTKSKLMNRRCHYIRETVKEQNILVRHEPKDNMRADCLTKPLSGPTLLKNVKRFMSTMDQ